MLNIHNSTLTSPTTYKILPRVSQLIHSITLLMHHCLKSISPHKKARVVQTISSLVPPSLQRATTVVQQYIFAFFIQKPLEQPILYKPTVSKQLTLEKDTMQYPPVNGIPLQENVPPPPFEGQTLPITNTLPKLVQNTLQQLQARWVTFFKNHIPLWKTVSLDEQKMLIEQSNRKYIEVMHKHHASDLYNIPVCIQIYQKTLVAHLFSSTSTLRTNHNFRILNYLERARLGLMYWLTCTKTRHSNTLQLREIQYIMERTDRLLQTYQIAHEHRLLQHLIQMHSISYTKSCAILRKRIIHQTTPIEQRLFKRLQQQQKRLCKSAQRFRDSLTQLHACPYKHKLFQNMLQHYSHYQCNMLLLKNFLQKQTTTCNKFSVLERLMPSYAGLCILNQDFAALMQYYKMCYATHRLARQLSDYKGDNAAYATVYLALASLTVHMFIDHPYLLAATKKVPLNTANLLRHTFPKIRPKPIDWVQEIQQDKKTTMHCWSPYKALEAQLAFIWGDQHPLLPELSPQ